MKVRELIEKLNELVEYGYEDTEIFYYGGGQRDIKDVRVVDFIRAKGGVEPIAFILQEEMND